MRPKQIVTMLYGVTAIAVGLWRHLETGESPQAVGFGVVLGGLAIVGGFLLMSRSYRGFGIVLILISLGFVSGWFIRRLLSGHEEGLSPRIILALAACAVELVVLVWPARQPESK